MGGEREEYEEGDVVTAEREEELRTTVLPSCTCCECFIKVSVLCRVLNSECFRDCSKTAVYKVDFSEIW